MMRRKQRRCFPPPRMHDGRRHSAMSLRQRRRTRGWWRGGERVRGISGGHCRVFLYSVS